MGVLKMLKMAFPLMTLSPGRKAWLVHGGKQPGVLERKRALCFRRVRWSILRFGIIETTGRTVFT